MEKLTLEHLAPYLPYGIKYQYEVFGTKHISNPLDIADRDTWQTLKDLNRIKLILRPMSDVKTIIETEDGPKHFASLLDLSQDEDGDWCERVYADQCESPSVMSVITSFNWWLFQYHFDVFGLIEKGLAISIHDVKEA